MLSIIMLHAEGLILINIHTSNSEQYSNDTFPWFVDEYFKYKSLSELTIEGYVKDLEVFFDWLVLDGFCNVPFSKISISDLDKLTVKDAKHYKMYLETKIPNINRKKLGLSRSSVARKLSVVSSLFDYLANKVDHLDRNIFYYINKNGNKDSDYKVSKVMREDLIITDKELNDFLNFVSEGYETTIKSKRQINHYKKNRERDTAIISLLLGSGLRLNDIVSLQLEQLDLMNNLIHLTNKDNSEREVSITYRSKLDLEAYLKIRNQRYMPSDEMKYVFFTLYNKKTKPMHVRSVQDIVVKYASASNKDGITGRCGKSCVNTFEINPPWRKLG